MEPYDIEVATGGLSTTYTVYHEEDGRFKIMQEDEELGRISAQVTENGITWHTDDDIDDLLLSAIGKAVEAQEEM